MHPTLADLQTLAASVQDNRHISKRDQYLMLWAIVTLAEHIHQTANGTIPTELLDAARELASQYERHSDLWQAKIAPTRNALRNRRTNQQTGEVY